MGSRGRGGEGGEERAGSRGRGGEGGEERAGRRGRVVEGGEARVELITSSQTCKFQNIVTNN